MSAPTNPQVALIAAIIRGTGYHNERDRLLREADKMLEWLDERGTEEA